MNSAQVLNELTRYVDDKIDLYSKELEDSNLVPGTPEWESFIESNAARLDILGDIHKYIKSLKSLV